MPGTLSAGHLKVKLQLEEVAIVVSSSACWKRVDHWWTLVYGRPPKSLHKLNELMQLERTKGTKIEEVISG